MKIKRDYGGVSIIESSITDMCGYELFISNNYALHFYVVHVISMHVPIAPGVGKWKNYTIN